MKSFLSKYKVAIISIIVAILLEVFVCNFGFFRTLLVGNTNLPKKYSIDENKVKISNINTRVTSIYFEYNKELSDKITYNLSYQAEGNSDVIELNPKVILRNNKQYINFDTHSECKEIEVSFLTENDLEIENIVLNHPNFNFSIFRILILFIISVFILKLKNGSLYEVDYNPNSRSQNGVFVVNLIIICLFVFLYLIYQLNFETFFVDKNDINKSDSILMQTEALVNGQVELMEEPSKELKEMENPYDNIKRDNNGVNYLYDVAFYNGNYYNYFGIAPILTSILPFRLITGGYLQTAIFTMLYIFIAILALYSLYKKLVKKYIKKISLLNFYLGFYAILFGSNIFTLLRGMKYDIVVSSGIAFLLISLNLAMSIYDNKYKYLKLVLLGISTALIVLSKPTLIVYYLMIAFLLFLTMKDKEIKEKIKDCFLIVVPLGIFAIFQMIFNYLRFDNIFEFGAKYQLTGFNMQYCMGFTFGKVFAGIMEYLFKMPVIRPLTFPFIFPNTDVQLMAFNELCYENRLVGLLAIPIIYGYLLKKDVVKNKELKNFINIGIIASFLSLVLNTCCGGICEVYSLDFKMILAIGAVIILLKWVDDKEKLNTNNKIFMILCVATILIMLPLSLTTESSLLSNLTSDTTVFLKNIFEFWT